MTFAIIGAFFAPFFAFAYSPTTTHKGLTRDIVLFYEHNYGDVFSNKEESLIEQGAVDEDANIRALFHFYDPVYNRGIKGNMTSKEWAQNTKAQARFDPRYLASAGSAGLPLFRSRTDFSWNRAVYEYVYGDRERALITLGHILHLLEDASVPDHTRNDAHPPFFDSTFAQRSPYEYWTGENFGAGTTRVARKLIAEHKSPVYLNDLGKYFDAVAEYSNKNFFSRDTIFDKDYTEPQIDFEKEQNGKIFGYSASSVVHKLVRIKITKNKFDKKKTKEYFLTENDNLILADYWNLLSREAVMYGAGVVKLFFDSVQRERETHALREKNKSIAVKIFDKTRTAAARIARRLRSLGLFGKYTRKLRENKQADKQASAVILAADGKQKDDNAIVSADNTNVRIVIKPQKNRTSATSETGGADNTRNTNTGIFGDGVDTRTEGARQEISTNEDTDRSSGDNILPNTPNPNDFLFPVPSGGGGGMPDNTQPKKEKQMPADTIPPDAPDIIIPDNLSQTFSTTTITFSGTTEPEAIIDASYVFGVGTTTAITIADSDGNWVLQDLVFGQGMTTIQFFATDASGNTSNATNVELNVDTRPNQPSIVLPLNGQVFATSTIVFSGTSSPAFTILNDFSSSTTTADAGGNWTLSLSGFVEGTTTIGFIAKDTDGLASSTSTTSVFVDTAAPVLDSFAVIQCQYSLRASGCLSATTTLDLLWDSASTDISYYSIAKDDILVATTTNTSYKLAVTSGTTSSIAIVVYDTAGNSATSTIQSVEATTTPLVINEVAWSGTASSTADEWIEIYNRTPYTLDLSNTILYAKDDTPYLALSGTVPGSGYYLIERTSSTTTSIDEDIVLAFSGLGGGSGLMNAGEALFLVQSMGGLATTTIDRTPSLSDCPVGGWCAGTAGPDYRSMERVDVNVAGTQTSNWLSNNKATRNGTDAGGNPINGTPKSKNSASITTPAFPSGPPPGVAVM